MKAPSWRPRAGVLGNGAALIVLAAFACACLRLQGGWPAWSPPGAARVAMAVFAIVFYAGACAAYAVWRRMRGIRSDDAPALAPKADAPPILVVHASQTGFAEQIARQTVDALRAAGCAAHSVPIAQVDAALLARTPRALFVVSTTGEGDAPDAALGFVRDVLDANPPLAALRYGVLALGDREYTHFCAFGRRLDAWLQHGGAQPLFDRIDVDAGDDGALRHWQHHLGLLAGNTRVPDWSAPTYARWRMHERRLMNAGSAGESCYHIALQPLDGALPVWRAGDIAEIGPRHAPVTVAAVLAEAALAGDTLVDSVAGREPLALVLARSDLPSLAECVGQSAQAIADRAKPLPHREYSIASVPADGAVHLLVRQFRRDDARLGLGSGWLTRDARAGGEIALRIRGNANFHAPATGPLILIGNGTGIAGLRALLCERIAAGQRRNWLLFGERNAACDFHYRDEILAWHANGCIARLDLAFSRDQPERVYVQQRVREAAATFREWIAAGAAIHVCGSLAGMAPGVHAALIDVLGAARVDDLLASGRYRRDVY